MTRTRRHFLATSAAAAGAITLLPFEVRAAAHASDQFDTPGGPITVHPVAHASFVMETPVGAIYVDPVGDPAQYEGFPAPDLILITHEHGDHFKLDTLQALAGEGSKIITNPAVFAKLPEEMQKVATALANGDSDEVGAVKLEAIPAYNLTEERRKFHPQGRDNGYVLSFESFRIYISGDTEDIPEMRGLKDIDLAFVCMNLPFTMDVEAAASAVAEFAPRFVYPYHYRGRDGGTQDPETFAKMIGAETEVRLAPWYG